jgi:hypothetical protein
MKMKRRVVGLVASALLVASMTTTAFAADSPSTDKVTPTCAPTKEVKCTGKEVKCTGKEVKCTGKEGKSDKTGETVPVFPAAAAVCLAGATLFGTKIKFEEE